MNTKIAISTFAMCLILLSSCNKDDDCKEMESQLINKEFVFALVSSQEECDLSLANGVNCAQTVTFDDNTNATIIVTDIVNSGTYVINGNIVTITVANGDVENPMIFSANEEFTELTRTSDGSNDIWKLNRPNVAPWDL